MSVYYTANVTAFSSEYHGDSMVTGDRSLGGMCVCGVHAHVQVFVCKVVCMSSMRLLQNVGFVMLSGPQLCFLLD